MVQSFQEFATSVFKLYETQKYDEAFSMLERDGKSFPEQEALVLHLQACLLALQGQADRALKTLATSIEAGNWYYEWNLEHDSDLQTLKGNPEFERLIALSNQHIEKLKAKRPKPRIDIPPKQFDKDTPSPLLIALHGNNSSAELSVKHWQGASDVNCFVALPMSTQPFSATTARWDDESWAGEDVTYHLEDIVNKHQIDSEKIVIGGFSMGARQSLSLGLSRRIPAKGIIALGAALGDGVERWTTYLETAQAHKPRVCLLVGDADDPKFIYEPTKALAERLQSYGIPYMLKEFAGVEHDFPDNFGEVLKDVLAWIFQDD